MTTTRIDHTGHNHPSTTAARTACRKAMKAATPVQLPNRVLVGKGETIHIAVIAHDGTVIGAACGAGLQRGVRKASTLTPITCEATTCMRCVKVN